jgi:hypothetical protein
MKGNTTYEMERKEKTSLVKASFNIAVRNC